MCRLTAEYRTTQIDKTRETREMRDRDKRQETREERREKRGCTILRGAKLDGGASEV